MQKISDVQVLKIVVELRNDREKQWDNLKSEENKKKGKKVIENNLICCFNKTEIKETQID